MSIKLPLRGTASKVARRTDSRTTPAPVDVTFEEYATAMLLVLATAPIDGALLSREHTTLRCENMLVSSHRPSSSRARSPWYTCCMASSYRRPASWRGTPRTPSWTACAGEPSSRSSRRRLSLGVGERPRRRRDAWAYPRAQARTLSGRSPSRGSSRGREGARRASPSSASEVAIHLRG